MRIELLDEAHDDLVAGYHFYEKQSPGLVRIFSTHFIPRLIRC